MLNIDANHNHTVIYNPLFDNKTSTKNEEFERHYDVSDLFKIVNVIYNVKDIISNGDTTEQAHSTIETTTAISPTYEVITIKQDVPEKNSTEIPPKSDIQSRSPEIADKNNNNEAKRNGIHNIFMDFDLIGKTCKDIYFINLTTFICTEEIHCSRFNYS